MLFVMCFSALEPSSLFFPKFLLLLNFSLGHGSSLCYISGQLAEPLSIIAEIGLCSSDTVLQTLDFSNERPRNQ